MELRVGFSATLFNIFCPASQKHNGSLAWLIIQDRQSNNVSFNRTWAEYRQGFGNVLSQADFWIGNENLYWLTNHYPCRLQIELTDWYNETRRATYETFLISHENDNYRMQIDGYRGNVDSYRRTDSE